MHFFTFYLILFYFIFSLSADSTDREEQDSQPRAETLFFFPVHFSLFFFCLSLPLYHVRIVYNGQSINKKNYIDCDYHVLWDVFCSFTPVMNYSLCRQLWMATWILQNSTEFDFISELSLVIAPHLIRRARVGFPFDFSISNRAIKVWWVWCPWRCTALLVSLNLHLILS